MTDLQLSDAALRIEARRARLQLLYLANERHMLGVAHVEAREAFWCPADDVDTWNPESEVSRQYLQYLAGGQDPRD